MATERVSPKGLMDVPFCTLFRWINISDRTSLHSRTPLRTLWRPQMRFSSLSLLIRHHMGSVCEAKHLLTWPVRFKVQEDVVSGGWSDTMNLHAQYKKHANFGYLKL